MESQFHSIPEVSQAFDEAVPLLFLGAGIEVVGAEVLVRGSVLQRVIDGREDRSRNGENGFLEAAPGFDAVVLGVDVAAQAHCTGVVLSQGDPLRTRVEFSRALVAARADVQAQETSLAKRLMSAPISERICSAARFLTPCTELLLHGGAKGPGGRYFLVDSGNGGIEGVDLIEMQPQQQTV